MTPGDFPDEEWDEVYNANSESSSSARPLGLRYAPIARDAPLTRAEVQLSGIEGFAKNPQVQHLLRRKSQNTRLGGAGVIPKPVTIQPVREFSSGAIIQWRADSVNHSTVCDGIESNTNLVLRVDGFDELFVTWYHKWPCCKIAPRAASSPRGINRKDSDPSLFSRIIPGIRIHRMTIFRPDFQTEPIYAPIYPSFCQ
jgi:hypothetical protein